MEEGVIAYDAVQMALGGSSPPPSPSALHLYDYKLTAIASVSSAAVHALPNSLVLRTVIHDKGNTLLHAPSSEAEEEVEFLSLFTNADDDLDDAELAISPFPNNPQFSLHPPPPPAFEEPPWLRRGTHPRNLICSPLLELHREIVTFCELISPTTEEHQLRSAAIERVSSVIKLIWKQCQVNVFGSFAIGLYLPTSDIDMVILDSGCCDTQSGLRALAKALTKEGVAKNIQVIGKARVPIVKFVETESHISFDVRRSETRFAFPKRFSVSETFRLSRNGVSGNYAPPYLPPQARTQGQGQANSATVTRQPPMVAEKGKAISWDDLVLDSMWMSAKQADKAMHQGAQAHCGLLVKSLFWSIFLTVLPKAGCSLEISYLTHLKCVRGGQVAETTGLSDSPKRCKDIVECALGLRVILERSRHRFLSLRAGRLWRPVYT